MADQVKLFVGGLPSSFGEEELRQLFSPHGVVKEAVMLASKSTSGQRCGFVWFQTRTAQEMAAAAIATLSDRHCPPGVDKPIQVSVAKNSAATGRACGRDTSSHAAAAFPGGGPPPGRIADVWPVGACGGLKVAGASTACTPHPPPALGLQPAAAMGLPGVPHCWPSCGAAASPTSMPYVPPAAACDAAAAPGGGVCGVGVGGVCGVGVGDVDGAPPWAPLPQIAPHALPPHALPPHAPPPQPPPPHDHPTAQENPAGSARMPVKLFVGSLPGGATTAALQQIFQPFGQIHEIHLMPPSARTGDRCAFVSFRSKLAAQAAVEQLDGRFQVPPSPRTIVVQLAKESNKRPRV